MDTEDSGRTEKIRQLNDALRRLGTGGRILVTAGLTAHGDETVGRVLTAIREFAAFGPDNDPHGEHDCAVLEIGGLSIIWKIDYYDLDLDRHSPDPADPAVTARVMTVMLADEY